MADKERGHDLPPPELPKEAAMALGGFAAGESFRRPYVSREERELLDLMIEEAGVSGGQKKLGRRSRNRKNVSGRRRESNYKTF